MEILQFFGTQNFIPHGYCISWSQTLLWLNIVSDSIITVAYYSIPVTLLYFVRERRDLPYKYLFYLFGAFIIACGTTHLLDIVTLWYPLYWIDGIVKVITALASMCTTIALCWVIPAVLRYQSPSERQLEIEIEQRKIYEQQILELAFYDPLTNLPNRRLLVDRIGHARINHTRTKKRGALLMLDLDDFKDVNDTYGHDQGDLLLKLVAKRLISSVRECDTVSRLGGDEFVILLEDFCEDLVKARAKIEVVATKVLKALNEPYELNNGLYTNTASLGITIFDGVTCDLEELLKQSDNAMYKAKKSGKNKIEFY